MTFNSNVIRLVNWSFKWNCLTTLLKPFQVSLEFYADIETSYGHTFHE